ncbi:hypothetical protein I5677_14280 [Mobilitalea sibirica]|uniref:Uncharacterized protein n=1 Tax=Mobilitalea sibirica TaxID=1462919 RepID=A0A8J7HC60_9FIRM|nr:hypothetical protein [Mobilitalea sibirica]MBH1942065.1 hypothetical protein [Mobilitalea sibirica]
MSISQITNAVSSYEAGSKGKAQAGNSKEKVKEKDKQSSQDTAVVYEKNNKETESKKVYQRDEATINRLLEEAEKRTQSLRDLVEKMLLKQGQTLNEATDIYALLREGKLEVDPETRAKAAEDVAEDGYWGVKQTSERLVSFAKALTGGDPSMADKMIDAVKKGFEEATKAWGGELPGICKETLDATICKLEEWRDSIRDEVSMDEEAKNAFQQQAASAQLSK